MQSSSLSRQHTISAAAAYVPSMILQSHGAVGLSHLNAATHGCLGASYSNDIAGTFATNRLGNLAAFTHFLVCCHSYVTVSHDLGYSYSRTNAKCTSRSTLQTTSILLKPLPYILTWQIGVSAPHVAPLCQRPIYVALRRLLSGYCQLRKVDIDILLLCISCG